MSDGKYATAQLELRTHAGRAIALEMRLRDAVTYYRAQGVPWSVIGDALGVSKQAAQQRYGEKS